MVIVKRASHDWFVLDFLQMLVFVKYSAHWLPLHNVLEPPWIVQNADSSDVYTGLQGRIWLD
jgi:hypothetical protein